MASGTSTCSLQGARLAQHAAGSLGPGLPEVVHVRHLRRLDPGAKNARHQWQRGRTKQASNAWAIIVLYIYGPKCCWSYRFIYCSILLYIVIYIVLYLYCYHLLSFVIICYHLLSHPTCCSMYNPQITPSFGESSWPTRAAGSQLRSAKNARTTVAGGRSCSWGFWKITLPMA